MGDSELGLSEFRPGTTSALLRTFVISSFEEKNSLPRSLDRYTRSKSRELYRVDPNIRFDRKCFIAVSYAPRDATHVCEQIPKESAKAYAQLLSSPATAMLCRNSGESDVGVVGRGGITPVLLHRPATRVSLLPYCSVAWPHGRRVHTWARPAGDEVCREGHEIKCFDTLVCFLNHIFWHDRKTVRACPT